MAKSAEAEQRHNIVGTFYPQSFFMKKPLFALLFFSLFAVGCEKETISSSAPEASNLQQNAEDRRRVRVRLRHGTSCMNELGVCVIIGSNPSNRDAPNDGYPYGTALAVIEGNKLRMTFEQPTATSAGTVPITEDIAIDDWVGHRRVIVKAGQYQCNFEPSQFGEISADVQLID